MPAPISLIVPTLNAADGLPALLHDAMAGLDAGLVRELIITDGGSIDGTLVLAEAAGAHIVEGVPGRGGQLKRGCAQARGDWFFVLHSDSRLPVNWPEQVALVLGRKDRAHAFRLAFDSPSLGARWTAGWANLRSRLFHLPYGDQGLLIHRSLYEDMGGYPDIPLMEDVAMSRALGPRVQLLNGSVITSAAKYTREGWLRRGARNLWTLSRYFLGVSPERLVRGYAGKDSSSSSSSLEN